MRRSKVSRRAGKSAKSGFCSANACESLERRTLLCGLSYDHLIEAPQWSDALEQQSVASRAAEGGPEATDIIWSNRGQASDNFSVFGTSANAARAVVDAAIAHWERVITSWNRADGTTTLQVNISISGGGYGGAGAPAATAPADGRPTTGSFTLTTGNVTPDPNDSNGWYFDPQPNDWSEYDVPIDAFSGSSTTATGPDFYSVAVAELTHVLGLISDKNNNGGSWNGYRLESSGMATNTNIMDSTEGGGVFGRFYGFDGPTVDHLMTSYNSGDATNASWGNVIHSAGQGANINWNIVNWQTGGEDVGNAAFDWGERTIPSWVMAHILADAYGYTITDPEAFGTMYVSQNANTGLVTVRGGVGTSSDLVTVNAVSVLGINFVTIAVDVGNDPAGTRHLAGAGNLPAWSTTFIANGVSGIDINGGGGTDYLRLESTAGRPVTLSGGDGDDFIDFGFVNRNLSFINGNVFVQGGSGFDQVFVYDNAVNTPQTFTITSARFDRPGWGGFSYASDTENHVLTTGIAADTVNVTSTFTAQPVVVASAGGGDAVNVGGVNGLQSINADVQIQNDPSFTTLQILNGPDSGARSWSIGISGSFGYLTGMAPANIYWDNADIAAIGLMCGSGVDTGTILALSETLQINNTNGDNIDQITLGNGSTGVQQITSQVTIDNDPDFTDIIIDDTGNASARNVTLDFISSYNVLSGLSINNIRYDDADTRNVTIRTGSAADTVNVLRTQGVGFTTTITSFGGADAVNIGNATTGVQSIISTNLYISNPPNFSTMSINNGPDTVARNVTIDANPGVSQWIDGLAPFSQISWNTNDVNGAIDIPITFGSAQDTINIARTLSRLSISTTGGADIATVGNNTNGCDNIQNNITFQNPPSFTSLTVNDTGNTTGRTWTIASSGGFGQLQLSAFLMISYKLADTSSPVTMNLGSGNDTVRVTGVDTRTVVLNGNDGDDTFEFGAFFTNIVDPINAAVTVNGGNDSDTVRFINTGDVTENGFNVIGNVVSHADMASVTFNTTETAEFQGGTNGVTPVHGFLNITPGVFLVMFAGPGHDVINVTNNPSSALFVRPSGGLDDVNVNHLFNAAGAVVYINETTALGTLNVNLNSRVVMPLSGTVLSVNSLSIDPASGQVDLYDNAMVWNYSGGSPLNTAKNYVQTGFAGGAWVGPGIGSSFAAFTPGTGVGFGEATDIYTSFPASFAGVSVDNTSILFRTTLLGDANLNRTVDLDDFNIMASSFNTSGKVFTRGNFTYDAAGNVNLDDFNALAGNFGSSLASTARGTTIRRNPRIGPVPTLDGLFAYDLIRASDSSEEVARLMS